VNRVNEVSYEKIFQHGWKDTLSAMRGAKLKTIVLIMLNRGLKWNAQEIVWVSIGGFRGQLWRRKNTNRALF